jgi:putative NADH-flavin reductase
MKLVLFGATGHTGAYILEEALKAGHEVTVLVRHPEKLRQQSDRLKVVTGDAMNEEDVLKAVKGQDAVLSAISEGPEIQHKTQTVATGNMISAMQQNGVERIICLGSSGILQFNETELIRDQPSYDALYRPLSYEHSSVNKQLQQTQLKWTQVCPPTILAAPADGKFAVKAEYPPTENMEVNAGNIGAFMMQELEKNEFIGKRTGITNA